MKGKGRETRKRRKRRRERDFRDSLMVRMSACRVLDRGSIPRRGAFPLFIPSPLLAEFCRDKRLIDTHYKSKIVFEIPFLKKKINSYWKPILGSFVFLSPTIPSTSGSPCPKQKYCVPIIPRYGRATGHGAGHAINKPTFKKKKEKREKNPPLNHRNAPSSSNHLSLRQAKGSS